MQNEIDEIKKHNEIEKKEKLTKERIIQKDKRKRGI